MEPVKQEEFLRPTEPEPAQEFSGSSQPIPFQPERRKSPRAWESPPAPVPPPRLGDYKPIVGEADIDELHFLARELKHRSVAMVNSTAVGGGVAEMLNRLVPLTGTSSPAETISSKSRRRFIMRCTAPTTNSRGRLKKFS
jgi:hypothetical protein